MKKKEFLEEWFKENLKFTDYQELAQRGHPLFGITKKTWYNYRHSKTRIPADVAAILIKELTKRGYTPFEF